MSLTRSAPKTRKLLPLPSKNWKGRIGDPSDASRLLGDAPDGDNVIKIDRATIGSSRPTATGQQPKVYRRPAEVDDVVWKMAEHWIESGKQVLGQHPAANWENLSRRLQEKIDGEPLLQAALARHGETFFAECLTWMVDRFWRWLDSLPTGDSLRKPGPDLQTLFLRDNWNGLAERAPVTILTRWQTSSIRIADANPEATEDELLARFPGKFHGFVKTKDLGRYLDKIAEDAKRREDDLLRLKQEAEQSYFASIGESVPAEEVTLPEAEEDQESEEPLRSETDLDRFIATLKSNRKAARR